MVDIIEELEMMESLDSDSGEIELSLIWFVIEMVIVQIRLEFLPDNSIINILIFFNF